MEYTLIIVLLLNAFVLANSGDPVAARVQLDALLIRYNQQLSSIPRTAENNQILLDAEFWRKPNYNYYDIRMASLNGVEWHRDCHVIRLGYGFNTNEFGLPHFTLPRTMEFFTAGCAFTWSHFFLLFRYFQRNHDEGGLRNINIIDPNSACDIKFPYFHPAWIYPIPQDTHNKPSVSNPIQLSTVGCMQLPWLVGRALIELMNQRILKCPRIERIVVTGIPDTDLHLLEQVLRNDLWKEFTQKSYSTPVWNLPGKYMVIQRKQQFRDYVHAEHTERLPLTFNRHSQARVRQPVRNLNCALGIVGAMQCLPGDLKQMVVFDYAKDMHDIAYNQYLLDLMDCSIEWHTNAYEFFGYAISSLHGVRASMKKLELSVPHLLPELSLMVFPATFNNLYLGSMDLTWEDLVAIFAHGRIPDLALLQIRNCGTFGDKTIPIPDDLRLPRVQKLVTGWNTFLTLLQNNVVSPTQVEGCEIMTHNVLEDELCNPENLAIIQRVFPEEQYQMEKITTHGDLITRIEITLKTHAAC